MYRRIHPDVEAQLRAAVQDPRLDDACLLRVVDYMCRSEEFTRWIEEGPRIPEPHLGWWKDHTGGRSRWFAEELVPAIERSGSLAGLRVLDFGAGTGSSAVVFAERGARVVGAEAEVISLRIGRWRARSLGVADRCDFVRIPFINPGNRLRLPFADRNFDVVMLVGVLEHMLAPELAYCAREIERVLRPGGRVVVFDTPNRLHPFDHHTSRLWFVGWMPVPFARWWAIRRGRIRRDEDFARRGGVGLSRRAIDRLFPRRRWETVYEKPISQIASEFEWLEKAVPFLSPERAHAFGGAARRTAEALLPRLRSLGVRPALFPAMHTVIYRHLP